ncbi:trehalose utilization-domain-containing protein [Tribonema minus]|uniref:Trehalose utilization-domain-containing protein n=1 Tax=Tribonema minus TaxID=303371 RepID=A0A835Z618_9STRA|nr:trehalose utilization-domain-containing protein [Tribonema minus]
MQNPLPITSATAAINSMAAQRGWAVTTVTAGATFPSLTGYSAFMSLFAGGETIPSGHRADLEAFIDAGNGFVGVQAFMDTGIGFVGVQAPYRGSATAWPFYTQLVGVTSKGSPSGLSTATVRVEDPAHPATSFLKRKWSLKQTWENYDMNAYAAIDFVNSIRERVHVLATVDESSYSGGTTGRDHPISWCQGFMGARMFHTGLDTQGFMGGRMFHTGLGGADSMWSDTNFKTHLAEGIAWALFQNGGDCNAGVDRFCLKTHIKTIYTAKVLPQDADQDHLNCAAHGGGALKRQFYRKTQIKTIYSALRMAAAPKGDERIFIAAKNGLVQSYYPSTGIFKTVVQLSVSSSEEQGLLGIALDPQFATTKHVFLYYSPSDTGASGYTNRLSRFKLNGDVLDKASEKIVLKLNGDVLEKASEKIVLKLNGDVLDKASEKIVLKLNGDVLDKASEKIVLEVPEDQVMHSSGAIHFDNWGDLWLSLGDNTDYKLSGGWAPINAISSKGDARRTSATNADTTGAAWRTSANSNDLRGSILRIRVDSNGGYSCPDGNLFPRGTSNAKCEIYSMGMRNPFSFALHPTVRGVVIESLVAALASPPVRSAAQWRHVPNHFGWPFCVGANSPATSPNFFGWPFCVGANSPYVNWDYSAPSGSQNKGYFKCDTNTKITNSSKWNTDATQVGPPHPATVWRVAGSSQVGPPQPATVWYNTQEQTNNPDIIRSTQLRTCAMLPYAHRHDKGNVDNECALPGYYDNENVNNACELPGYYDNESVTNACALPGYYDTAAITVDFIRGELNHAMFAEL